jgi:hypothetical protein
MATVEMNAVLFVLQASWFIILAYPEHCDCLALLNAIQRQQDQAAS